MSHRFFCPFAWERFPPRLGGEEGLKESSARTGIFELVEISSWSLVEGGSGAHPFARGWLVPLYFRVPSTWRHALRATPRWWRPDGGIGERGLRYPRVDECGGHVHHDAGEQRVGPEPCAPLACRGAVGVGRRRRPANEVGRRVDYTPRDLLGAKSWGGGEDEGRGGGEGELGGASWAGWPYF